MSVRKKLLLIDGNSLLHRAFHALPASLTTSSGQPTNAVYGLAQMLLLLLAEHAPDAVLVAFDAPGPTFRHEQFADYKANRPPMDEALASQVELAHELVEALGLPQTELANYEADDIIGTMARRGADADHDVVIVTGDRDMLQLVDDDIKVLATLRGLTNTRLYDAKQVTEEYGINPDQMTDYKALAGDSSDNIPGVPGVGPKTAATLLAQFPHVEELLERLAEVDSEKLAAKLADNRDTIRLSKALATIATDSPVELELADVAWEGYRGAKLRALFGRLEFTSLLKRAPVPTQSNEEAPARQVALDEAVAAIQATGCCNLAAAWAGGTLAGLALAAEEVGVAYLPLEPPARTGSSEGLFSPGTDTALPEAVAQVLEDANIGKRGSNLKNIAAALDNYDIRLSGCEWDPTVADYLIAPQRDHGIDVLAGCYLHKTLPPPEQAEQRACQEALLIPALRAELDDRLNSLKVMPLLERVEMPLIEILRDMERAGIAVDSTQLEELGEQMAADQEKLAQRIHQLAGCEFNINSPQQLGQILFEKLELPGGRRTKTGWSTAAAILDDLAEDHEIVAAVLEYRQLAKLCSTYVKGLLEELDAETGRVHTTFEQTVTATGRLSSRNPNLQNIPKRTELGRAIRACFVAGAPDRVLLCADYSQIELRILAHFSGDKNLVDAFAAGEDIHRRTAAVIFDLPIEQVTARMRGAAKTVNYAVIYGMGGSALAAQLDISRKEADKFIEDYFRQLPGVQQYMKQIVEQARQDGYVETICGRRRPMPELRSNNHPVRAYAERAAANTPLQGSAADIIKIAMVDIAPRLAQVSSTARMLLQVHDELVFEVANEDVDALAKLVKEIMESAWELSVPLSVDIQTGSNWRDLRDVP